jgi:hypothetical protein
MSDLVVAKVLVMAVNALVELLATEPVPRALLVVPESRLLPSELVVLPKALPSELVVEPSSDEVVCDRLLVSLAGLVSELVPLSSELVRLPVVPLVVVPVEAPVSDPVVPDSRLDRVELVSVAAPAVPVLAVVPLSAEVAPESSPLSEEVVCEVSVVPVSDEVVPDSRLDRDEPVSVAVPVVVPAPVRAEVVPDRTLLSDEPTSDSVLPSVEVAA